MKDIICKRWECAIAPDNYFERVSRLLYIESKLRQNISNSLSCGDIAKRTWRIKYLELTKKALERRELHKEKILHV